MKRVKKCWYCGAEIKRTPWLKEAMESRIRRLAIVDNTRRLGMTCESIIGASIYSETEIF